MQKILYLIASVLIYCFTFSTSFAQSDSLENDYSNYNCPHYFKKDIALITGYQLQKSHFVEIGIGIMKDEVGTHHPSTLIYGISNEFKLSSDFIWGLKVGFWMGGGAAGMNLGANLINYTNFTENSIRFRPEIGVGFNHFRIVYGYNLALTNKNFEGINRHNFGLNIILNLKTIKKEAILK